tara:strand:+ start:1390 stop:2154 length:765 start_codon:yes stop_codon:yes gene_type:complete
MKLGIIQGRLSEPKEGFQECPIDWKREFDLLSELGLTHIEWIITEKHFHSNPIFYNVISKYSISSVCADFMVSDKFCDSKYLMTHLEPLCLAAEDNNIKNITIPLLENSSVEEKDIRDKFMKVFYPYTKEHKNINFLIEAELHQEKLKKMLDFNSNLFVTYDTGNITSCGLNHEDYIFELADKIKQVHIKDRIRNPLETVEPTKGDTDFELIFKCLKQVNYDGLYTLQTARMKDGKEIETIKRHKKIIEGIYND